MNKSTFLPDRIISIPWLAFKYEGVSLSQMIYSPNACKKACETNDMQSPRASSSDSCIMNPSETTPDDPRSDSNDTSVLVHPSVVVHFTTHP